jgi:Protein of unknown function (DUF3108)
MKIKALAGLRFGFGLASALAAVTLVAPAYAEQAGWPTGVSARYKLSFNGFDVGSYQFQSQFDGKAYTASSNAEVSALFGAFKWKGTIESRGALAASGPQPLSYQMNYKTKKKAGSVTLGFDKAGVQSVALVPEKPPHPDAVPLKPENLKSVVDPMTTILAMTHATSANPCDKKIAVFDGKARFDLVLSRKGTEKITDKQPSGQPALLVVCTVKYVPIAGHKPKDFVDPWVNYSGIEIALRSVPSAHVFVPYRITIPTSIGAAVMSVETVNITAPGNAQIALTQ